MQKPDLLPNLSFIENWNVSNKEEYLDFNKQIQEYISLLQENPDDFLMILAKAENYINLASIYFGRVKRYAIENRYDAETEILKKTLQTIRDWYNWFNFIKKEYLSGNFANKK